jgi:DNA polymerase-3 subunit alpha
MSFTNLHGHTEHSHLDAIIRIKELFARAKQLGHGAVAITDHGVMGGLLEAYREYKSTGIKFIPGNEIYYSEDLSDPKTKRGHLILLAANEEGYKNLLRITAESYKKPAMVIGRTVPRVNSDILRKYNAGLFVTSACMSSLIADGIFRNDMEQAEGLAVTLKEIFGKRFFIELQPHTLRFTKKDKASGEILQYSQVVLNDKLKALAEKLKIPMVATCDSHYLIPDHEVHHDMIQAISSKKAISDLNRKRYASKEPCEQCAGHGRFPIDTKTKCNQCQGSGIGKQIPCPEYYLKSDQEVRDFFTKAYSKEFAQKLIHNTERIANACENPDYIEPDGFRLPSFDMKHISQKSDCEEFLAWRDKKQDRKDMADDNAYMRYQCWIEFHKRFGDLAKDKKKIYWDRIVKETSVLEDRGFSSYMLIVSDYMTWARDHDIFTGPGRGSGGGSLIGYLLGIHELDPIRYGLLFERFVNRFKKDLPDYDSDFAPSGLVQVYGYIEEKYGAEYVAKISNISRITPKVAIKDIARSLQVGGDKSTAFTIANEVTNAIPDYVTLPDGKTVEVRTLDLAMKYCAKLRQFLNDYPDVEGHARALIGLPRNFSMHAAGVVISDVPLPEYVPLRRDKDGIVALQYDKHGAEYMGLVKMDLLGLETLDIMKETYQSARNINVALPKYNQVPEKVSDSSRVENCLDCSS